MPELIAGDPNLGWQSRVLHAVYDFLWLFAGFVLSPVLIWRCLRQPAFRAMIAERLGRGAAGFGISARRSGERERVLIHAVSVGEVLGARSLIELLARERSDIEPILSVTTDTGLSVARGAFPTLTVLRFPADISWVVRRFFKAVDPSLVVLVELEIWPNFLRAANRSDVPLVVVNGRITPGSFGRYRVFKRVFPQFNRIALFCVQSETYADRFRRLQVPRERIVVTGNVKVDGLALDAVDPGAELRRLLGAADGQPVLVAGSTHEPEEGWVTQAWARAAREARLVLVPRHPKRADDLVRALGELGFPPQRLTELRAGVEAPDRSRPALVDTIGELERVYGLADLAFVGGSLIEHGGQNVLEPAAQGVAVVSGPNYQNFQSEMALLLEHRACRIVKDADELTAAIAELLAAESERRAMGARGQAAVALQRGATEVTWGALDSLMPPAAAVGG